MADIHPDHIAALLIAGGAVAFLPAYIHHRLKERTMTDQYMPGGSTRGSGTESWWLEVDTACGSHDGVAACPWTGTATIIGEGPVGEWDCPRCHATNTYERN